MTEIKALVVGFKLDKHPDADTLSIASIDNTEWQCVVRTEDFINKSKGIFIPIDGLVDVSKPEFKFLDKNNTGKPFRIKTMRLRGFISQGLLIQAPEDSNIGDDYTEALNVLRYEAPEPIHVGGDSIKEPSNFTKYTSIQNYKNYPNVFVDGEMVRGTEKLHGMSFRVGHALTNEEMSYHVGSHNTTKHIEGSNIFSEIARNCDLENKIKPLLEEFNPKFNMILFCELFGSGVQDLLYGCKTNERDIRIFDFMVDGKYQVWDTVSHVADVVGIKTVPLLYRGQFNLQKILELRNGLTTLGEGNIREGVVITAEPESRDKRIGRKVIKFISDEYLLRKGAKDIGH